MGERGSTVKGLGRRKGCSAVLVGQRRWRKPLLGLSWPEWHLEKIRSFRCGGQALGCQNMWGVKASQIRPHTFL